VGTWIAGTSTIAFDPDAWFLLLGSSVATISADGLTMNDSGTVLTRALGSGPIIDGVWVGTYLDAGITWVEDRHYRPDGTYTIQWTADGSFDSVFFGSYSYRNEVLAIRERRALVATGLSGTIAFDVPFGPDSEGTYLLITEDELVLAIGGVSTTYTRM
jgi:hypothetical protein